MLTAETNRVGSTLATCPGGRSAIITQWTTTGDLGTSVQSAARTSLRRRDVPAAHERRCHPPIQEVLASARGLRGTVFSASTTRSIRLLATKDIRVYLMEGVYVYHWYRADADSIATSDGDRDSANVRSPLCPTCNPDGLKTGRKRSSRAIAYNHISDVGVETAPKLRRLEPTRIGAGVPVSGHRILLIGHDVGSVGELLKARNPGLPHCQSSWMRCSFERTSERLLELVHRRDSRRQRTSSFPTARSTESSHSDLLENRAPAGADFAEDFVVGSAQTGRFMTQVSHRPVAAVVEGLLEGRWLAACGPGESGPLPIRFYTRREIEKLLFRAGFSIDLIEAHRRSGPLRRFTPGTFRTRSRWASFTTRGLPDRMPRSFSPAGLWSRRSLRPPIGCAPDIDHHRHSQPA